MFVRLSNYFIFYFKNSLGLYYVFFFIISINYYILGLSSKLLPLDTNFKISELTSYVFVSKILSIASFLKIGSLGNIQFLSNSKFASSINLGLSFFIFLWISYNFSLGIKNGFSLF